jgi:hypothetical protein
VTITRYLVPLAIALAACRPGGGSSPSVPPGIDPCRITSRAESPNDTAMIGADGIVSPNYALPPTTPADRLAFAQAFETLVRVRCDGRLAPGLAHRWSGDTAARVWTLAIRPDARFSDGTAVTANDVLVAWRERREESARRGIRGAALEGVTILGDREIAVHFRDPQRDGPRLLADPQFAVHHRDPHLIIPMGTGPYLDPDPHAQPIVVAPRTPNAGPVLIVQVTPSGDARDLIDRGLDVFVTWDRRAVEYAATRAELQAMPLATDRAYVLLSTARAPDPGKSFDAEEDLRWAALRASLARDVVRDAAPTAEPWWATRARLATCAIDSAPSTGAAAGLATRTKRLVFPSDDRLAGELARRIVALTAYDRGPSAEGAVLRELIPELLDGSEQPLVAVGLGDVELSRALARGADLAYLIVLPRRPLDPCASWRNLSTRSPWVTAGSSALVAEAGPTLITGPHAPAMTVDWDNTIRFATPPGSMRDPR